jgi:integrase
LKIYKSLTIQEILDLPTDCKKLPKPITVNKKLGFFSTLLDFGVQRDMLQKNPAIGIRVKELGVSLPSDQKPHYSDEDIQDIIHRLHYDPSNPARFFVPLLATFTGARRRELCQLYVSDIREVDGIPCLDINGLGDMVVHTPKTGKGKGIPQQLPEKHLKYPASWRLVPINPVLWYELGFGGFIEECRTNGQKKLFPELGIHRDGPGTAFSKWYDVEIAPHVAGSEEPKKTFHSFRHAIQTWFKHRQLEGLERTFANEILKEVIGHAYNKSGAEDLAKERYGKKYPPAMTSNLLFQLNYGLYLDVISEQVEHLNNLLQRNSIQRERNPNLEYPTEDNREQ